MIDLHFEDKIFESYHMFFSLPLSDPKCADLKNDAITEYEGEKFYIIDVWDERSEDGVALKSVQAEAQWMRLTDRKSIGTFTIKGMAALEGLELILRNTDGWSIIECTTDATERSMEATDASVTALLWQWARVCGCEIKFDNRAKGMSMVPQIGTDRGVGFRYSSNLKTIKRQSTSPEFTRIYPIGKNDLTISSVNGGLPYLEDYSYYTSEGMTLPEAQESYRKDLIMSDDTIIEAQTLFDVATLLLAARSGLRIKYTASVIDISELIHESAVPYVCGDSVGVVDEPTSTDTTARVSRTVKWPHHPDRNVVDLSFTPIELPDVSSSAGRGSSSRDWELFSSRNDGTPRQVRAGSTILGRMRLTCTEGAEWVVGYHLSGIGVGTGTLTITPEDDEELVPLWSEHVIDIVDGEPVEFSFTYGRKEIPAGDYLPVVRAHSSGVGIGIDIEEGDTAFWILARGTTRQGVALENSVRLDYNGINSLGDGTLQQFTVPDDVDEIQVEMAGARGGGATNGATRGKGTTVIFKLAVTAGEVFDFYIAGFSSGDNGGWPNGGAPGVFTSTGGPGGGATSMRRAGLTFADSIAVAPGGGGSTGNTAPNGSGGDSGFYEGEDGTDGGGISRDHGDGATQEAPGAGGVAGPVVAEDGDTDGQGFGGDSFTTGGHGDLGTGGGGGGGGWHGGGGAATNGGHSGGGGGAGMANDECYDLEFFDANNDTNGYAIISWETIDHGV